MKLDSSKINRILVVTLSNIGDVILTFPVIDVLKENFRSCELSVVTSPKAAPLFKGNSYIKKVHIFDKHQSNIDKLQWILQLRKERFDLTVDLRQTAIPLMIRTKNHTPICKTKGFGGHKRFEHLERLKTVFEFSSQAKEHFCLSGDDEDQKYIKDILKAEINQGQRLVVVALGAADKNKRWKEENFAIVSDRLTEKANVKIVFVGDEKDRGNIGNVKGRMSNSSLNFAGQTTLTQLAELLRHSSMVLANDSAIMHMASYLDIPVLALFGPTPPELYGPWSSTSCVLRKEDMGEILPDEVLDQIIINPEGITFKNPE